MLEPLAIGNLQLKNRIFKAATHDACDFAEMHQTYGRLARNDVALITVAYVAVSPINKTFDNQHHIGLDNADEWRAVCDTVHAAGGKISAQLHHPGLFCLSSQGRPMGPSFFWLPSKPSWPKTIDREMLETIKKEFIDAAALCVGVGFDCIELHCGHGYLLSQFLTPIINRRSDGYGGSLEARARFPAEIIAKIRDTLGEGFPILVKMNADDGFPFPGGLKLEQSVETAKIFVEAGADAIIPSYGYTSLNGFGMLRGNVPLEKMTEALPGGGSKWIARALGPYIVPQIEYESLFLHAFTQRYIEALRGTKAKVIYVGGADSSQAIKTVLMDGCAAVQIGRPLIREPFLVRRIMKEESKNTGENVISKCIRCNMCTLASMDPVKFKSGCPFLKPGEGADIEDVSGVSRF